MICSMYLPLFHVFGGSYERCLLHQGDQSVLRPFWLPAEAAQSYDVAAKIALASVLVFALHTSFSR